MRYVEYGRVTNVSMISAGIGARPNRSAAGGVIGAIVGGLLGNQIGSGSGRAAATVLGAAGGRRRRRERRASRAPTTRRIPVYRVTVQTDQGHDAHL